MAVFQHLRKGSEAMKKAAQSGGKKGGYVPNLRWKDDQEKHYVLFLQSIEETPTVLFHKMMDCGVNEQTGKKIWRDFISQRDPEIAKMNGISPAEAYDPLDDRGYRPTNRTIAVVCEMEPVLVGGKIESFVPMTRTFERTVEGGGKEEVTEPAVSLVIESPGVFFPQINAYADEVGPIEDQVFLIRREGKDQNTSYSAIAMNKEFEAPENAEEAVKRLEEHVETLADEAYMRKFVDSLPEDHVFNKYAKMKGGKAEGNTSSKPAPKAKSSSTKAEPAAAKAEPKPKKRSRFEELQAELTGNK